MAVIGTWKYNIKAAGVDNENITLKTAVVPRNQTVEVTHASLSDYTTKNRKLIIGIRDVSNEDTYLKVAQDSARFSLWLSGKPMLYEGECMIGIVENTDTGDELFLSVHGRRYRAKEG